MRVANGKRREVAGVGWFGKAAYEALLWEDGRAAAERMLRAWFDAKPGSWVRGRVVNGG